MHNTKQKKGVSLAEVTIVLGLIGIFAVTMLSLNNFQDPDAKTAMIKLEQVDNALKSWSKAVVSQETGNGVDFTDQASLDEAFNNYFSTNNTQNNIKISYYNIHKLILASFVVASKYNEDNYFSLGFYAKLGGISIEEMFILEYEFIILIPLSIA